MNTKFCEIKAESYSLLVFFDAVPSKCCVEGANTRSCQWNSKTQTQKQKLQTHSLGYSAMCSAIGFLKKLSKVSRTNGSFAYLNKRVKPGGVNLFLTFKMYKR